MKEEQNAKEYKLKLEGEGVTIERTIPEAAARHVINLLMASAALVETPTVALPASEQGQIDPTTSPKAFLLAKKPMYDVERVACLGYYLANYRNTPHFKTKDLTMLNVEAAQPPFSNTAVAVKNAAKYRYLGSVGGGKKQLITRGEAVVNALPNRDKVKEALQSTHMKPRGHSRKTNKKPTGKPEES